MATRYAAGDYIDYTPSSAVKAGDVVVLGDLVTVADNDIAANAKGAVAVSGVYIFPKDTGSAEALAVGTKVYWDANNEVITATASTHKQAGYVVEAAAASDATVKVLLARG